METGLSVSFSSAIKHAKDCIVDEDLVLKNKRVVVLRLLYQGKDCFVWLPRSYCLWQKSLLPASTASVPS